MEAISKQHYDWWGYIKSIIRKYPENRSSELSGVALRNHEAVKKAVDATLAMDGGADRLKVIGMVHWERTRTLDGAALAVPCEKTTAYRWQRKFFEETARNRDLLDGGEAFELAHIISSKWECVGGREWACLNCDGRVVSDFAYPYCPWCGAKMK